MVRCQHTLPQKRDVLDILFLCVVGTFWHYLYGVSGNTYVLGLIAPVNESLWEHGKLGLGATMILLVVDVVRHHQHGDPIPFVSRALGLIVMNTFIIVAFLLYTSVLSHNILVIDVILYYASCYIAVVVHKYLANRGYNSLRTVGILLWVFIVTLYAIVTP